MSWSLTSCFPYSNQIRSDQSLSRVPFFATPWSAAYQASLSITNSRSSLRLTSIESVMPSSHLILCRPLLLLPPSPPSIRVFSNESTLHMRWPKYWSFSFSIIPSKEIPGLISFRMDGLDVLAVQGTLKSLLQHQSSKASILWRSAFFLLFNKCLICGWWGFPPLPLFATTNSGAENSSVLPFALGLLQDLLLSWQIWIFNTHSIFSDYIPQKLEQFILPTAV